MSNAIIKQQGDSPLVADNIWEFRLGAGSFILVLPGPILTAAVGRLATKNGAGEAAHAARVADQLRRTAEGRRSYRRTPSRASAKDSLWAVGSSNATCMPRPTG